MRIFALETNIQRLKKQFLAHGEGEIFTAHPHLVSFLIHIVWEVFITILLVVACSLSFHFGIISLPVALTVFLVGWATFVFFGFVESYLNWKYDFIFLTTDKLIIVDQSSLFRKSITPISLENLGDVSTETQWLNLLDFGIIHIALKEGKGPKVKLRYMPKADQLVAQMSEQITLYQRRKDFTVPYRSLDSAE